MTGQVVASLEALFTANTDQVDAAFKRVKDGAEKVEKKPVKTTVDADVKGALAGMGRVESGHALGQQVEDVAPRASSTRWRTSASSARTSAASRARSS